MQQNSDIICIFLTDLLMMASLDTKHIVSEIIKIHKYAMGTPPFLSVRQLLSIS